MKAMLKICGNCTKFKYNNFTLNYKCENEHKVSPFDTACNDFNQKKY